MSLILVERFGDLKFFGGVYSVTLSIWSDYIIFMKPFYTQKK